MLDKYEGGRIANISFTNVVGAGAGTCLFTTITLFHACVSVKFHSG